MAQQNVGSLIINLEARTAQIQQDMSQAKRIVGDAMGAIQKDSKRAAIALGEVEDSAESLARVGIGAALAAGVAIATSEVGRFTEEIITAQREAEKLSRTLFMANGGNLSAVSRDMEFLSRTADDLGVRLRTLGNEYGSFAAVASRTSMAGQTAKDVFEGFAVAASAKELTMDEFHGALISITQMMGKGKVASEELYGQLAERLPEAAAMAASSMGMTSQAFRKALENGEVMAEDLLPRLAWALKNEMGDAAKDAAQGLTGSMNAYATAVDNVYKKIAQGGAGDLIASGFQTATSVLTGVSEHIDDIATGLEVVGNVAAAAIAGKAVGSLQSYIATQGAAVGAATLAARQEVASAAAVEQKTYAIELSIAASKRAAIAEIERAQAALVVARQEAAAAASQSERLALQSALAAGNVRQIEAYQQQAAAQALVVESDAALLRSRQQLLAAEAARDAALMRSPAALQAVAAAQQAVVVAERNAVAAKVMLTEADAQLTAARTTGAAMSGAAAEAEARLTAARVAEAEASRVLAASESQLVALREAGVASSAAYQAATQRLTAAKVAETEATSLAAAAGRGAGVVLAALGGPIGLAITALTLLALNWDKVADSSVHAANMAEDSAKRIKAALDGSHFADAAGELERAQSRMLMAQEKMNKVAALRDAPNNTPALRAHYQKGFEEWAKIADDARGVVSQAQVQIRAAKSAQVTAALALGSGVSTEDSKLYALGAAGRNDGRPENLDSLGAANAQWVKSNQTRQQQRKTELDQQREFLEKGLITQEEYARRSAIINEKYADKKARSGGRAAQYGSTEDREIANLKALIENEKLAAAALAEYGAEAEKLTPGQKLLNKLTQEQAVAKTAAAKAHIAAKIVLAQQLVTQEKANAADRDALKLAQEKKEEDARRLKSINDDVAATEEQVRNYGLNAAQIAENTALTSELSLAEAIKNGSSAETIDTLRQQADAYRRLADAQAGLQDKKDVEGREKLAADEAKKAADEWQKSADQINQSLTDALMQGFEDGKGFAENFADSLKATFKTMVLRPVIQAVMQPVGEAVNGMINGQPGAAGGQQSMFSGGGFGANAASGLGQLVSGFGSLTGSAGTAAYGAGMGLTADQAAAAAQAYTDAGMTDIANSITAGQSAASAAATAATYAGYAMAAYNGFKAVEEGRWGSAAGTAIGAYFGGPMGAAIGAQVGGMVDDAFGGGGGEKSGGNYNAAYDASGKTVAENLFGGYTPDNADGEVKKAVTGFYKTYADTVRKLGGEVQDLTVNLGFDTDPSGSAGNRLSAQLAIGQIGVGAGGNAERELWQASLVSMVSESVGEIPQAIQDATGKMLLAALQASELPEEYARIFDGVDIEAASADQVAAMTAALESTKLLSDVFNQFGTVFPQLAGVAYDAREAIVAAAGGLDVFASGLSAYRDNFYSDSERAAADMRQLQERFDDLHLTMPATRDGFRQLVEAQDLATLAGQGTYAALIGLSGAFAEITAASEAARSAALTDARQDVADAYRRESDALQSSIDRLDRFVRGLRDFRNGLALSDLSTLSPEQKYAEARQQFEVTLAAAQGGDEAAQEQMQEVSSAFLEASRAYNASSGQYAADYARVTSATLLLESSAKAQLSLQRQQLDLLQKQVDGLLEINESVLSVVDAIKALEGAMAAAVTTPAPGGVGVGGVGNASGPVYTGAGAAPAGSVSPQHAVNDLYKQILGREADVGGLLAYSSWVMQGKSLQEVAASLRNSDEYKSINGSHADGLGFVPFDGYRAELHRGEAVLTAQQNRVFQSIDWSRFGNADNAALLSEFKALRAEVSALRADNAADADAGRRQAEAIARATLQQGGELATSLERTAADRI